MAGLDKRRLVLIHSVVKAGGVEKHFYGTGYFVTRDLVLTARHVLSRGLPEEIEVRLETPAEGQESPWVKAEREPVWESEKRDAALLRVSEPIPPDVPPLEWGDMGFQENKAWQSAGYPKASYRQTEDGTISKSSGLNGTLYALGGGGPGERELELGVEYEAKTWAGISGAPVFVEGKLVGIIKSSQPNYTEKRLAAEPVELLQRDPGFRIAIAPKWLRPFPKKNWVLILNSENEYRELGDIVEAAVRHKSEDINRVADRPLDYEPRRVSVTSALESPEHLFQFIEAVCAAPVMIFDVTNFEPAVMMFLGIRAAVRRGVTLTITTKLLDESHLSNLPFNIQETKLIHLSTDYGIDSPKYPVNWIGSAIVNGLTQLKSHPDYLDLPAYNAVRCPEPKDFAGKPLAGNKVLMLCSFHQDYKEHWRYVSGKIAIKAAPKSVERMIDISSPRLVGLALYESIRWTSCCIVDWTHWRANVFFELGVRLACSDVGPISLIEEGADPLDPGCVAAVTGQAAEPGSGGGIGPPKLIQRQQLVRLLNPTKYKLGGPIEPFDRAFRRYAAIIANQHVHVDDSAIAHNAIYQTIVNSYYWQQEPISRPPHEELIDSVHEQWSEDPQMKFPQVLFSSGNPEFARELRRSGQERWIAAWYYLKGRYSMDEFRGNEALREELTRFGEEAAQWISKTPDYERIFGEIIEVIEDLKGLGEQQIEDPLQMIRHLKTRAKNRRDLRDYKKAAGILEEQALPSIEKELTSMGLAGWRAQLPLEISDCYGILGGIHRRWALELEMEQEQTLHLRRSVDAYQKGYEVEKNPEYSVANSYNMVNRLVSYLLLEPGALHETSSPERDVVGVAYDVKEELREAASVIREQLKEKRRGDIWALADLALVRLLLDQDDPATAYAEFIGNSPPNFAYESTLSTLRPLAELDLPVAGKLREAVRLLEAKLGQLQSSTAS